MIIINSIKNSSFLRTKGLAIIDSPLQLLNLLNLIEYTKYGEIKWAVVFLENSASDKTLFDKIKKENLFSQVVFIPGAHKEYVNRSKNRMIRYFSHLNKENVYRFYSEMPRDFYAYDYMCFCTHEGYSICSYAYRFNRNLKFIWLEDGMTTYVNYGDFFPNRTIKSFGKCLLQHNRGKHRVECQFLYHPELATYTVPCLRYKLPSLQANSKVAKKSDLLFAVSKEEFIKSKYIYFDNAFSVSGMNINDSEILQLVSNVVGKRNLTIKVHPKNDAAIYKQDGYSISTNNGIPWESYYFHADAVVDKVLIGVISTALLSPFLYFGSRQKVISLIEFLDMDSIDRNTRTYIEKVRDTFMIPHPDIYILPKNQAELENVLEELTHSL